MKTNSRWLVAIALLISLTLSIGGDAHADLETMEYSTTTTTSSRPGTRLVFDSLDLHNRTNITCLPCPAGTYTNLTTNCSGNIEATEQCPEGWCASQSECTSCAPGTYQSTGSATSCLDCADGYVAPHNGTRRCAPCPAGEQSNLDKTSCVSCTPGTYNKDIGGTCQPCGPGLYQPEYNSSGCYLCPVGTYGDGSTMAHCTDCGAGNYNNLLGLTSQSGCNKCPPGTYCPYPANESPLLCPAEYYCVEGCIEPLPCSWLQTSEAGASECARARLFWIVTVVVGLGGLVILALLISGVVVLAKRKSTDIEKPPIKKERLIPEPLGGPVYGGY